MVSSLRAMAEPNFAARNQTDVLVRERKEKLIARWLVACAPIGVYAVALAVFTQTHPRPMPAGVGPLLMLGGAVLAVLSVVLPHSQLSNKRLQARLREPIDVRDTARSMRLNPDQKARFKELPPEEQRLLGLTIAFERAAMLGLALANGVALLGAVYGLLSNTMPEAAPFLLGAVALNCWHYPRLKPLIDRGRTLDRDTEGEQQALALVAKLKTAEEEPRKTAPSAPRAQPRLRRPSRPQGPPK